jgi:hypothetical protein
MAEINNSNIQKLKAGFAGSIDLFRRISLKRSQDACDTPLVEL